MYAAAKLISQHQVEYAGINFLDIQQRGGSFPLLPLPAGLCVEAAGTIVALPTDVALLASEPFRKRGFQLGGKVACVSPPLSPFSPIPSVRP